MMKTRTRIKMKEEIKNIIMVERKIKTINNKMINKMKKKLSQ